MAAPPEVVPPHAAPKLGVEHDGLKKLTVYQFAGAIIAIALAAIYPAVMEVVRHAREFDSPGIEAWAYFVFFAAGLQIVYAIYLIQLPDWATTWVVTWVCAGTTMVYAFFLGLAVMSGAENEFIAMLGLSELHQAGYMSAWCLIITSLFGLLTYLLVRFSVRWHRTFELAVAGR